MMASIAEDEGSDSDLVLKLKDENFKLTRALKEAQEAAKDVEAKAHELRSMEENPSVAMRQVKAMERRMKVTEERLNRERTDRSSKLSTVEEKLINENSRLEVAENELKRKLTRENNRIVSLEKRVKDLREENESLSIGVMNGAPSSICVLNEDGSVNKIPLQTKIPDFKKGSDEWKKLLKMIEEELKTDQQEEIIHKLWYEKDTAWKQLAIWERQLVTLGSSREQITKSLKDIAQEKSDLIQKIEKLERECGDWKAHKEKTDKIMKERLGKMVKEKHETQAQILMVEDKMLAIKAERDSIKMAKPIEVEKYVPVPKSADNSGRQTPIEGPPPAAGGTSSILDEHIQSLNQDLENNRKKIQLLKDDNSKRQKELLSLQNELTTRIKENRLANETNQKLTLEKNSLKQKCEDLEHDLTKLKEDVNKKARDMASINFKYTQLEDEFKAARMHLQKKLEECAKSDADVIEMKQILEYKETEKVDLATKMQQLDHLVQNADQIRNSEIKCLKDADEKLIRSLRSEVDNLKIRVEIADQNAMAYREEKQKLLCEMQALGYVNGNGGRDRRYSCFGRLGGEEAQTIASTAGNVEDSHAYRTLHSQFMRTEENLHALEAENRRLKEMINNLETELNREPSEFPLPTITSPRSHYALDISDEIHKLKQEREVAEARHCKTLSQLKSAELSISQGNETREQLRNSLAELESAVDFLKAQVNRETAARKEAERRIENLLIELNGKALAEDQVSLHKANLSKAQTDLVLERKAVDQLSFEIENLRARCTAYETELKAMKRKLREKMSQSESLQTQLSEAKEAHENRVRSLTDSYSGKMSESEKSEKRKENENRQLKNELKSSMDKLAAKGEEILRLREEIFTLQEKLSTAKSQISTSSNNHQMSEVLKMMEEIQNLKLEKEELVKAVHDARRRMATSQTSASPSPEPVQIAHAQTQAHLLEMKVRLDDLEAKLQTEKKMHSITQKQLKNIWEDNDSLRNRLVDAKRQEHRPEGQGRRGSRMDEINEIIARSQGQARCILGLEELPASGVVTPANVSRRSSVAHE